MISRRPCASLLGKEVGDLKTPYPSRTRWSEPEATGALVAQASAIGCALHLWGCLLLIVALWIGLGVWATSARVTANGARMQRISDHYLALRAELRRQQRFIDAQLDLIQREIRMGRREGRR